MTDLITDEDQSRLTKDAAVEAGVQGDLTTDADAEAESRAQAVERAIDEIPREEKTWRLSQPVPGARDVERAAEEAIRESFRPRSDADFTEVGLIRRAAPILEAFSNRIPLSRELRDIYENFGVELAQTVFTQSLERSPVYGGLIRRVRSFDPRTFELIREKARRFEVTIVRSSLPIRGLAWGEFADTWQAWARSMGFTTDIIETQESNDLRANAKAISTYLFSNPHPRRILVTYGEGAAEFRSLLAQRLGVRGTAGGNRTAGFPRDAAANGEAIDDAGELAQIHTWINVAGAYGGAAIARFKNDSRWEAFKLELSRYFGRFPIQARAIRLRQLDSRLPVWRTPPVFPKQMQVINVVGLPFRNDLPSNLKVSSLRVTPVIGVNDGAVGLYESIAHPGLIVPVKGMTQMAERYKLEPVLRRLLAIIVESEP